MPTRKPPPPSGGAPESYQSISELDEEIRKVQQALSERMIIQENLLQVQKLSREVLHLVRNERGGQASRVGGTATTTGTRRAPHTSNAPRGVRQQNPTITSGSSNQQEGRCTCPCAVNQNGRCEGGSYGNARSGDYDDGRPCRPVTPSGTTGSEGYSSRRPMTSHETGGTSSSGTTIGQVRIAVQIESDSSQSRSQQASSASPRSQNYTTSTGTSFSPTGTNPSSQNYTTSTGTSSSPTGTSSSPTGTNPSSQNYTTSTGTNSSGYRAPYPSSNSTYESESTGTLVGQY